MKSLKVYFIALLALGTLLMAGCGGGGGTTAAQQVTLKGTLDFSTPLGKTVAAGGAAPTQTIVALDLIGNQVAVGTITGTTYSINLPVGNNYVLRATSTDSGGNAKVLRSLVDKATLATSLPSVPVNTITAAAVIVVEQNANIPAGTLGTSKATTAVETVVAAALVTVPPAAVVTNIQAAQTACTTAGSNVTAAEAQLATLVNIVQATVFNNIDPASFVAGTAVTTTPVTVTTYTAPVGGGMVASASSSVTAANLPQITSAATTTFTVGAAGTFNVAGTGTFTITAGSLPSGVNFSPSGLLSGTPATDSGTYPRTYALTITANSGGLTTTQAFNLIVNGPPPAVTSANNTSFTVGNAGSFTVTGTGTLSVSGTLPSGVTFAASTGILGGTPAAGSNGSYPLTITSNSGGSTATQTFTLTVNAAAVVTAAQTIMQSGIYNLNSNSYQVGTSGSNYVMAYADDVIKVSADATTLTDTYTYYDPTSKAWTATIPTAYPATLFTGNGKLYLNSTGWVTGSDNPQNYSATFNSDGTVTVSSKIVGGKNGQITLSSTDVSGQLISAVGSSLTQWPVNSASPFPAGSKQYNMVWTNLNDSYDLDTGGTMGTATSLSQVTTGSQTVYIHTGNGNGNFYAQFTGGGVSFYQSAQNSPGVLIGSGSYAISTVSGQQILEITIPSALRTQYKLGGNPILAIVGGILYEGTHNQPGIDYNNGGYSWNSVAVQFLQSSLTAIGSVTAHW